jgi:hypothetical protein
MEIEKGPSEEPAPKTATEDSGFKPIDEKSEIQAFLKDVVSG